MCARSHLSAANAPARVAPLFVSESLQLASLNSARGHDDVSTAALVAHLISLGNQRSHFACQISGPTREYRRRVPYPGRQGVPWRRPSRAKPCLLAEVAVREGPESWSPSLGLADPPFGTTEPGLRRFPPPGLSANAWDVTRGGCPRSEVRPLASRELALSALWRLEFGEALSASLSRCRSRAVIFRQPTRQPPRQPCALGRRV